MRRALFACLIAVIFISSPLLSAAMLPDAPPAGANACDSDQDGNVNIIDIQRVINEALHILPAVDDLDGDGSVTAADVRTVVQAALGLGCTVVTTPQILSVLPNSGQQGQTFGVAIATANTSFIQGQTQVDFGAGITVNSVTVDSGTSLLARITVASAAALGTRNLTVTSSQGVVTKANAFTITAGNVPSISSILPVMAQQGQSLTLTVAGQNTSFQDGQTQVNLGSGISVTAVSVVNPQAMVANLTVATNAATGARTLTITTGQESVVFANAFTVLAPTTPAILSVTPTEAEPGLSATIAVSAQNTAFVQDQTQVSLGADITVQSVTVVTPTSFAAQILVPENSTPGPRTLTVTTGTQVVALSNAFTVTPPTPAAILSVSPGSGQQGETFTATISGWNTSFDQVRTQVSAGAGVTASTVSVTTPQSLTVQFQIGGDATPGPRDVTVTTGAEVVTLSPGFWVATASNATQAITSVTPSDGPVGVTQTVTIAGANLGLAPDQTAVSFGDGISVQNVKVLNLNQLSVDVSVSLSAAPGVRTIKVVTGPSVVTLDGGFTVSGPPLAITSPADASFVNTPAITVAGQVGDPAAVLMVNGVWTPNVNGAFSTSVPLSEGNNTVTVAARSAGWATSTAGIRINLDTTPPHLAILSPPAGVETSDATITVSGMVNDIVVGTVNDQDATVTVNGAAAVVKNRTFSAVAPLTLGTNNLQVVALDRVGNAATASVTVQRVVATEMRAISGDNQTGIINRQLSQALVVELRDQLGVPAANRTVVFRVTGNDGVVSAQSGALGSPSIAVTTDAQGDALAYWTLGSRSGQSNNRMEVTSPGIAGVSLFTASGMATMPAKIVVDSGLNQSGATNEPLPLPFIAVVVDSGNNRLAGVPVTFRVLQGGGMLNSTIAKLNSVAATMLSNARDGRPLRRAANAESGQTTLTVNTDGDGRAAAFLSLGPTEGPGGNVVDATYDGNTGTTAVFAASGLLAGNSAQTRVIGVVLDNSGVPIPGVTIRLLGLYQSPTGNLPLEVIPAVQTDSQGQFVMTQAPVGVFKIMADGSTVQGDKKYPTLEFDITNVAGRDNTVNAPIYLKALDTAHQLCVTGTTGGTLTLPDVPGFALKVSPGSVTFPGGSRSGCLSVTPVNMDKIPMSPGFGQQPRFIVTIQPVGAKFDPPAGLSIPNVDGLAPRAVTEMYSYDHDLSAFVAIGTGTVSVDGSVIQSDPGVGVLKAGWHCGGNPQQSANAAYCGECRQCNGAGCTPKPMNTPCTPEKQEYCKSCDGKTLGGAYCCVFGQCTGLPYQGIAEASTKLSFDVMKYLEVLEELSPCALNPIVKGEFSYTLSQGCCEEPTGTGGHLQRVSELAGQVTFGAEYSCGKIIPLQFPNIWTKAGEKIEPTYSIGAIGTISATGFVGLKGRAPDVLQPKGQETPGCKDCTAEVSFGGGISASAKAEAKTPIFSASCGFGVGEGVRVTAKVPLCKDEKSEVSACFGPVAGSCSVDVEFFGWIGLSFEVNVTLWGKTCVTTKLN